MVRFIVTLIAVAQLCIFSGCAQVIMTKDVEFEVIDAETKEPIADADVSVDQSGDYTLNHPLHHHLDNVSVFGGNQTVTVRRIKPKLPIVKSDRLGHEKLKISEDFLRMYYVSKDGYLPLPNPFEPKIEDNGEREIIKFKIYKKPHPSLKIVVPNHYRGPVMINFLTDQNNKQPIGKRLFIEKIDNDGFLQIESDILRDISRSTTRKLDIKFTYQNGQRINTHTYGSQSESNKKEILARHFKTDAQKKLYIIGTDDDRKKFESSLLIIDRSRNNTAFNAQVYDVMFEQSGIINLPVSRLSKSN